MLVSSILIINNPNNPAGRLYTKEDLDIIYEQTKKRGIYLLVDEAYSDFILDEDFTSVLSLDKNLEGIIGNYLSTVHLSDLVEDKTLVK